MIVETIHSLLKILSHTINISVKKKKAMKGKNGFFWKNGPKSPYYEGKNPKVHTFR
jgi:hypothetical protein